MAGSSRWFVGAALLVALGLGLLVSPFASSSPDGLERVAEEEGFDDRAEDHALGDSPVAGYGVRGIDDRVGTGLSGGAGILATFGVGLVVFAVVGARRRRDDRAVRPRPGAPS
jgi:hypothetical protein